MEFSLSIKSSGVADTLWSSAFRWAYFSHFSRCKPQRL